jgi:hypothetical protein
MDNFTFTSDFINKPKVEDKWVAIFLRNLGGKVQLKCDGTQWRKGGEVKGKLASGVGSQYSPHFLGTLCIQHYYL